MSALSQNDNLILSCQQMVMPNSNNDNCIIVILNKVHYTKQVVNGHK